MEAWLRNVDDALDGCKSSADNALRTPHQSYQDRPGSIQENLKLFHFNISRSEYLYARQEASLI